MLDGKPYTLGVLLTSNHGALKDLTVGGKNVGLEIMDGVTESDKGSIIVVMATDIPMSSRQLKRVLNRISTALARVGSRIGHGSGEVFIGFTTANVLSADNKSDIVNFSQISEGKIDIIFRAVSETTEDALIKSMLLSKACESRKGKKVRSLSEYI